MKKRTNNYNKKINDMIRNINFNKFIFILVFCNLTGAVANSISPFPLYGYFAFLFSFIAIVEVLAISFFVKQMDLILIEVSGEPKFRNAKYIYEKFQNSKSAFIIPFVVIFTYGGTGIPMIQTFELNCSMLFALVVFVPTVYLSIFVYMQYINLAVFIYQANICQEKYLAYLEQSPANSKILYLISELVTLCRNSFFSIGTAYIIAFGLFTLSGAFGIDVSIHNFCLVLGWGIIAIAIVIVFPVVSLLEKWWLSSIIRNLKTISTKKIQKDYIVKNGDKLQASDLIISIWQTPDYPINETVSLGYGVITTLVNLITMAYYAKELFVA